VPEATITGLASVNRPNETERSTVEELMKSESAVGNQRFGRAQTRSLHHKPTG
jgi:hypothetical protein